MAWIYCTSEQVAGFSGLPQSIFRDSWSDQVESMMDTYMGRSYRGITSYDEYYDGDGTDTVFVRNRPISSVSSISVEGTVVDSATYVVYPNYIRLVQPTVNLLEASVELLSCVFPVGALNIRIVYSAGTNPSTTPIPGYVSFCAQQMLTQIALISERGGSDASIPMSRTGTEYGSRDRYAGMDVSGKLMRIMETLLPVKTRIR